MNAGRFGAPQERSDVLGILERIEDEDERRLAALDRSCEDVVQAGVRPWLDDQGDALMAVEPGDRGQRAALDLDDRDPERCGMEDEALECLASLRDDQQATGRPPGDERLLDRPAPRDELLILAQQVRGSDARAVGVRWPPRGVTPGSVGRRPVARPVAARPCRPAGSAVTTIVRRPIAARAVRRAGRRSTLAAIGIPRSVVRTTLIRSVVGAVIAPAGILGSGRLEPRCGWPGLGSRRAEPAGPAPTAGAAAARSATAALSAGPRRSRSIPGSLARPVRAIARVALVTPMRACRVRRDAPERRPRTRTIAGSARRFAALERPTGGWTAPARPEGPIAVAITGR